MREIKFRAWLKDEKVMVGWNDLHLETEKSKAPTLIVWVSDREDKDDFNGSSYATDNIVLMQYTGIKDEHGNEIYEGDILKWSSEDTDGSMMESLEKVVYRDGCFVLENEYGKITDLLKDGIKYNEEYEKVELVGNVYENAELLEGDHNE